jgi:hypothetical protein
MKPVLAFVLGLAIAGGVGFIAINRNALRSSPDQVEAVTPVVTPNKVTQAEASSPQPVETPAPVYHPKPVPRKTVMEARNIQPPVKPAPAPEQTPAPVQAPASAPVAIAPPPPPPPVMEERKPEPRQPATVTIPAGTTIAVRLEQALASDRNYQGDQFRATLDQPIVVDQLVIAERGARVFGKVVEVDQSGRVKGLAQLSLELTSLTTADGQRLQIQTERFSKQANSTKKKDAAKIGAGAGIGAIIGAIAGGGKGAAIGAGAGGAAGGADVLLTRGDPAKLPVETRMSFRLRDAVTVTEKLR